MEEGVAGVQRSGMAFGLGKVWHGGWIAPVARLTVRYSSQDGRFTFGVNVSSSERLDITKIRDSWWRGEHA